MQATQTATPPSPEMSSAFSRYRKYLKSCYNKDPVARDDKLSIAPCNEFISLALVKKGKSISKDDSSQSTLYGGRPAHNIHLELDDILASEKFVLVEGPPGIGKSTLSWELCRKWDTLKSLQHYCIVLLLKLREGRVQNATSLNELFCHRDRALCESVVSEVLRCEGEGVLLILDGFDEMPASVVRNKESLIMEIVSGTCIPRATRLVTSRPSALHRTKYFPQEFRHVVIDGFTDENIEKFAEIAFKSEPNVLSKFKKLIFSKPVIKSLMYIPVNCAILAQSYKDIMRSSKQVPKTKTQLYSLLTQVLIRRHLIAIGRWDEDSIVPDLKNLPEDVKGDLERVSKLAYTGLFKGAIQLVFTDSDVGEGFHHLGLLSEVKEMYVHDGAKTSYSFLHLSIQEFLAAWHVSCHQELVEEVLAKTAYEDSPRHVFGHMLAGLIGFGDLFINRLRIWYKDIQQLNNYELEMYGGNDDFVYCAHDNEVILYACHCLYEAQDVSHKAFYPKTIRLTTPLDMYVFGYCLACVHLHWTVVQIWTSIDKLVSSLDDHANGNEVLGSIETLRVEVVEIPSLLMDLLHRISIKTLTLPTELSLDLLREASVLPHFLESFLVGEITIECEHLSLSHALRRDPDTSQLKLRRSKSLSDVVCLKTVKKHVGKNCTTSNPTLNGKCKSHTSPVVKRTESCPDLVGFQSLHPLMEGKFQQGSSSYS